MAEGVFRTDLPRSVICLDVFDQSPVREFEGKNGTEGQYLCPYCADKRSQYGKSATPDTEGKLFINKKSGKGVCFRCSTVVLVGFTVEKAVANLSDSLAAFFASEEDVTLPTQDLSKYPHVIDVPEAVQYIQGRNPLISLNLIKLMDIRWYEAPHREKVNNEWISYIKKGILFPIYVDGEIKTFQIRYFTDDHRKRFYTFNGAKLCWSMFREIPPMSTITICEGIFSAIAAGLIGLPYPVAILGKTITPMQIRQLRNLVPGSVKLACDSYDINKDLFWVVKKSLRSVGLIETVRMGTMDPEEYLKFKKGIK